MSKANRRGRKRVNKQQAQAARQHQWRRTRRRRLGTQIVVWAAFIAIVMLGIGTLVGGNDGDSSSSTTSSTVAPTTTTTLDPAVAAVKCTDDEPAAVTDRPTFTSAPPMEIATDKIYRATIKTSCGDIVLELDAAGAPKTVNNFVFLAREHFYDGTTWHRIGSEFVIQGGSPDGSPAGGPGYEFEDELPTDGYQVGSIAMANSGPNTNGSQFFIVTGRGGTQLSNNYSRFGRVVEGAEVAKRLEAFGPSDGSAGEPTRPLYVFEITIQES